jgi:hypothetical protein
MSSASRRPDLAHRNPDIKRTVPWEVTASFALLLANSQAAISAESIPNRETHSLETVALIETTALLAAAVSGIDFKWAGVRYRGGWFMGLTYLGTALVTPADLPGSGGMTLGYALLSLSAYNFYLNSTHATKDDLRKANFWGFNLVGATWLARSPGSSNTAGDRKSWSFHPVASPDAVGLVAMYRF